MVDSTPTLVGPAVDDQVDASVEIGAHMRGESSARHGRTDWPRARPPARRTLSADRARSGGPARAPRSSRARRSRAPTPGNHPLRQHQGQRAGPEHAGEQLCSSEKRASASAAPRVRHMRDQRIEARAAFGRIKPRDRRAIGGVGAEAVDRLGRERHQPAVGEHARRRRDRVAVRASSKRVATSTGMDGFQDRSRAATLGRAHPPSRDEINDLPRPGRRHRLHAQAFRRACSARSRMGFMAT